MRNVLPLLALLAIAATFTAGCAGPQEKLGRGVRNTWEVVRLSELRTSMQQTGVWDSPANGYTSGVVNGVNHSLARTGIGLYEIVTFPFPPYHPVCTKYISPEPPTPDNYQLALPSDPLYSTDQYLGFSGGTVFGFVPGSHFQVLGTIP